MSLIYTKEPTLFRKKPVDILAMKWTGNNFDAIKDFAGKDVAGTNSSIEKIETGTFEKGDIAIAEFVGKVPVAPGKYTLSFSCTRYNASGNLEALSRKYDALLIEIITTKNTVGLVRMDSNISVHKIK